MKYTKLGKENNIVFFSYMVLEQGALSGQYDTGHPMPAGSARADAYNPVLDKLEVLIAALKKVADSLELNVTRFWEKEMK